MRKNSKKLLLIVCILLLIWLWAYYVFGIWNNTPKTTEIPEKSEKISTKTEEQKPSYTTVSPTLLDEWQSLTLIGTVLSNEFATVYARRSGIIKDLYIDIWDTVKENQTIGELLPPGDVGQSSANIYEKQVKVKEAEANLEFIQKVSEQMIDKSVLAKDLQEIDGDTASAEMIKKINIDIESSERELSKLTSKHKEQLKKIQDDLTQKQEQSLVLVESTLQTLEHILLWDDHTTTNIWTDDIRRTLGVRNTSTRNQALTTYRQLSLIYERNEYESISSLLEKSYDVLSSFLTMIETSTTSSDLTQSMLEEFTQILLTKQTKNLGMKEILQDLENLYTTTKAQQAQESVMLENMISKWKAMLGEKTAMLGTALEKAEQQVDLVTAEQDLKVQQAKNKLDIAKATLGKEYASSGNEKIVTPFGGTVSKRMVQVGDMVSMGMPLYELIDVPTSLSKTAKREIQFGLPEEYIGLVQEWDIIYFSTAQNDIKTYSWTIHRMSPQVDQMSKTVTVQATLPNEVNLPHNSRVNIILEMIEQIAYQVPSSTIMYTDGNAFLPILNEGDEVELLPVSVLAEDGEFADIQWEVDKDMKIIKNYSTKR